MKFLISIVFISSIVFINCSKDENISEIGINKNQLNREKKIVSEFKSDENQNSDKITSLQTITPKEVKAHVGDSLVIKGFVTDVYLSDKVAYLNFENKFPKNIFSCAIFSNKFEEFGDLSRFKNKNVEVNGKITTYKNKPQVILNSKDQIKIISQNNIK